MLTTIVVPFLLAVASPTLKWLLDAFSERFGQKRVSNFKARIEFYQYLLAVTNDVELKKDIKETMERAMRDFIKEKPSQKTTAVKSFSYGMLLLALTCGALVLLITNTILWLFAFASGYALQIVFVLSALCGFYLANLEKGISWKLRFLLVLPTATFAIYAFATFVNVFLASI